MLISTWAALMAVLLVFPGLAGAQESEHLFTVYGIEIDETARSAAEARRRGLAKAEEQAFHALIRRLTREQDLLKFQMPEGAKASDFVLGVEVQEARNSRVRYLGKVNITFAAEKIENLLGRQNIPFVGFAPEPTFVFPLFWQEGGYILWGKDNTFLNIWRSEENLNGIIRYTLPRGNLAEQISLGPEQILKARQVDQLKLTLSKYGTDTYVAAAARIIKTTTGETIRLELTLFRPLEGLPPEIHRFSPANFETDEDLLRRGMREIFLEQDRAWKEQALTQFGESREMALVVPVENAKIWAEIKSRLESSPVISGVNVARLALPETYIAITFSGTEEQLALALRHKGLILFRAGPGYALIRQEDANRYLGERGDK